MAGRLRSSPLKGHPAYSGLREMGESDAVARVLLALAARSLTLRQLQKATRLSAPTVRKALDVLDRRFWLSWKLESTGKRGAQPYVVTLSASVTEMGGHYLAGWNRQWKTVAKGLKRRRAN